MAERGGLPLKINGALKACLHADGNDPLDRRKLKMSERGRWRNHTLGQAERGQLQCTREGAGLRQKERQIRA